MSETLPCGSWPSPLTATWASAASPRFDGAAFVGDEIWWGESVPSEGGRTTVRRRRADGTVDELLAAPADARSRVHEYGGGSWTATPQGRLFFVEKTDQRVWTTTGGGQPHPLTPVDGDTRYGGLRWHAGTLLAVRERHGRQPVPARDIVAIAEDGTVTTLAEGTDFVAQPALSPDGTRLAWVGWNHPDMPWDRTTLQVGRTTGGRVTDVVTVAGGTSAALQPEWTADGALVYVDDPTDRWNLWRADPAADRSADRAPIAPADADTGGGLWVLGARWFAPLADGGFIAVRTNGSDSVVHIAPDGKVATLAVPCRARVVVEDVSGTRVLLSGAAPGGTGVWMVEPGREPLLVAGGPSADAHWYPEGRPVTFPGIHGPVHAFDYPPMNPDATGRADEKPPYVVLVHGGPTAHVGGVADSRTAYLTSRGIGVLEVNYGGSTGYGRAYRERLNGQWGVVDVDDVASAAAGLASEGRADAGRLAIAGGSAGGWTVLAALVGTDVFSAGISRYGIGDARTLAADTHDFEARYLDGLIGPLPEAEQTYVERSPLSRPDRFRVPLLLLQGAEDEVVPPSQSEAIRDALAAQGVPHAYVLYPGEGHGFRRAETIVHALETELAFLGQVFGFETPGVAPVALD
ncbi:prolyl oligopeptidase family serine peptidase [Microbacterium sp. MC2]